MESLTGPPTTSWALVGTHCPTPTTSWPEAVLNIGSCCFQRCLEDSAGKKKGGGKDGEGAHSLCRASTTKSVLISFVTQAQKEFRGRCFSSLSQFRDKLYSQGRADSALWQNCLSKCAFVFRPLPWTLWRACLIRLGRLFGFWGSPWQVGVPHKRA